MDIYLFKSLIIFWILQALHKIWPKQKISQNYLNEDFLKKFLASLFCYLTITLTIIICYRNGFREGMPKPKTVAAK